MSASAVIGALRVNLGLNSASFRGGLDQAQGKLNSWGLSTKATFIAVAAAVAGAATAIAASVRGSINSADEMSKTAQKFGVPIDTLSRLAYAGKYADVSLATLATGIGKLSKNMADIAMGKGKDVADAFTLLGVNVTDTEGKLRASQDVIYDIADKFAAMPNGVAKTALAIKVFGKSGAELIPLLNGGSAGLKAMGDEAERLGFVLDQNTGSAAEAFNDKLTKVGAVFEGLSNKLMVALLPALNAFADMMVAGAEGGSNFDGVIAGITAGMNILVKAIGFVFTHLQDLYDLFKLWAAARIVLFAASVAGSMIALARTIRTVGITMKLVTSITHAKITALLLLAGVIAKVTGTYDTLVGWIKDFGNTIMSALPESVRDSLADFGEGLAELGAGIDEADSRAADTLEASLRGSHSAIDSFGSVKKSVDDAGDAIETAAEKAKTFSDRVSEAFKGLGTDIRGLIDGTLSWNDVLANVLETAAKIALQQIDFTGGGKNGQTGDIIGSFIGGLFGFANGGSFTVGGGGGTDSQLVAFKATPGEDVVVGHDLNGGPGGQSVVIQQSFSLDGAIDMPTARAVAAQMGRAAVEQVKRELPGWSIEQQKNGAIA